MRARSGPAAPSIHMARAAARNVPFKRYAHAAYGSAIRACCRVQHMYRRVYIQRRVAAKGAIVGERAKMRMPETAALCAASRQPEKAVYAKIEGKMQEERR